SRPSAWAIRISPTACHSRRACSPSSGQVRGRPGLFGLSGATEAIGASAGPSAFSASGSGGGGVSASALGLPVVVVVVAGEGVVVLAVFLAFVRLGVLPPV